MINLALLKKSFQSSYKILLIFMAVLAMYMSIIIGMFDPNDLDILNQLAELKLSPQLLDAMGFTLTDTSLAGFLASYFYGMLMLAFPMICYIMLCNNSVAKLVEKGSMANLLSTPLSRTNIIATQITSILSSITILITFVTLWGIAFCEIAFPSLLNIKAFIQINIGVLLLHIAISSICFFFSCLFNESRMSLMFGAGIPIAFLLIHMLGNANKDIKILKYLTIFTLYKPLDIIQGESQLFSVLILIAISVLLYTLGGVIFNKKDLPI